MAEDMNGIWIRLSNTARFLILFVGLYIALSFIRSPLYNYVSGWGLSDLEILIVGLVLMLVCGYWAGEIE